MVTGHGFRLALILTAFALLTILLSGGLLRIFSSRISWALIAFTAWLCFCIPFSVWRGGSYIRFQFWLTSLVSFLLLAGCVEGLEQCRKAMYTLATAVLVIELSSFFLGTSARAADQGRFSFISGTFANSNDLAALLLMGVPFCLLGVRAKKGFSAFRIACFFGLLLIPMTVVRTGSRGGLLALVFMFVLYFMTLPPIQKIPVAVVVLLLAVAAMMFSTRNALDRYRTILHATGSTDYSSSAAESAEQSTISRRKLFVRSVRMTLRHPLLGVGPGMFEVADANDAGEEGIPAIWHETHNTFTQVSSEEGLPGLFFYVAALFFCFRAVRTGRRVAIQYSDLPFLGDMAFCLQLSLIAFTVTGTFASNAYYFFFPLLAGLSAAFDRAVAAEIRAHEGRPESPNRLYPPPAPPAPRQRTRGAIPARPM